MSSSFRTGQAAEAPEEQNDGGEHGQAQGKGQDKRQGLHSAHVPAGPLKRQRRPHCGDVGEGVESQQETENPEQKFDQML